LIAINPYVLIPTPYTDARIREYRGKSYFELSPHAYSLADDTYRRMTGFEENLYIIITYVDLGCLYSCLHRGKS